MKGLSLTLATNYVGVGWGDAGGGDAGGVGLGSDRATSAGWETRKATPRSLAEGDAVGEGPRRSVDEDGVALQPGKEDVLGVRTVAALRDPWRAASTSRAMLPRECVDEAASSGRLSDLLPIRRDEASTTTFGAVLPTHTPTTMFGL